MKNVNFVVENGLCTSCGICQAACAKKCIHFEYGSERNTPAVDKETCVNCGICYDICPGKGVKLQHLANTLWKDIPNIQLNEYCGYFLQSYTGFSNQHSIRYHSASGGMVTQFLIYCLREKVIDGAVVIRFKENDPLTPEPFIATTEEEILCSKSSKYVVVSFDNVAEDIVNFNGKLAFVGLPCHIQAMRMLAEKKPKCKNKIIGYFAIYCSLNKTKHSVDYYLQHYKVNRNAITGFSFRDDGCLGFMKITGKDNQVLKKIKYEKYWHGTHSFFANSRCSLCIDHFGELADISFGDIHINPFKKDEIGINSLIARSSFWDAHLQRCKTLGLVTLDHVNIESVISSQPYAIHFKKGEGVKCNFKMRRLLHKQVPEYDCANNSKIRIKTIINETSKSMMRFIGKRKCLWSIIHFLDK